MSEPQRLGLGAFLLALVLACSGWPTPPDERVPAGRLPGGVRPVHYDLELEIDPDRSRFSGIAAITVELDRPVRTIWLHGRRLEIRELLVQVEGAESRPARWEPVGPWGVAALRLPRQIGPGTARLRIAYDAAFDEHRRGFYRVEVGGEAYAFTHFEPTSARLVFPGFDEPAFKTPFDVSLVVREDHVAVGNTPAVHEEVLPGGGKRIRFATTQPLPTYLLAWAVGPFDVVEAPPLHPRGIREGSVPFRGIAVRGRGAELAYALAHTPPLIERLADYFGSPYPYAKLDVIAVPDFGPGAMENAGAIFFREAYLLLDGPHVSEAERRGFAYVMAHELAHQWFGNLVTLPWWNDLWLNEAFATWLGRRIEGETFPENEAELASLEAVHWAMQSDALVTARSIHRTVEDPHDIADAFDAIAYSKGSGVLAMFERWLGPEVFRNGIARYLARHRAATATEADLLDAFSRAAGRDVATPFRTFLTQPGVPLVEAESVCDASGGGFRMRQSRHLPLGSTGEREATWQIPVCIRYGAGGEVREACQLLTEREARLSLEGDCPAWFMPNADGAGYYRFTLGAADWRHLQRRGWRELSARERLSVADNLEAAFRAGAASAETVYGGLGPLAADGDHRVVRTPISLLKLARDHLVAGEQRASVERFGAEIYAPHLRRVGWDARPGEDRDVKLLRRSLVDFLALESRDRAVRHEAARRGRRYAGLDGEAPDESAVEPELVETVLSVVVQEGEAADFDALVARLSNTDDAAARRNLLRALSSARDRGLAARARALSLDPALRASEVWTPLYRQSQDARTRAVAWRWTEEHFDALVERAGRVRSGWMPWLAAGFCDEATAEAVATFLAPRIEALEGGPRHLAASLEAIDSCAALVAAQGPATARFFAGRP